jgi:hypothetical protein
VEGRRLKECEWDVYLLLCRELEGGKGGRDVPSELGDRSVRVLGGSCR